MYFIDKLRAQHSCSFDHEIDFSEKPQHSLPDVFIWMVCHGKKTAYRRILARDIAYSPVEDERGRYCFKVFSIFLKWHGKKEISLSGGTSPVKLQLYMWLGPAKYKREALKGLTRGYSISDQIQKLAVMPSSIHYTQRFWFQLRAHIYQGRQLPPQRETGLSNPFARVVIGCVSKATEVVQHTLNPIWDEFLLFDEILTYGEREEVKKNMPYVVTEIYDLYHNKTEYVGRMIGRAQVKLKEEPYAKPKYPPTMSWHKIYLGNEKRGEILAAFEMLELDRNYNLPPLPTAKTPTSTSSRQIAPVVYPVPIGIRPTLVHYRLDVLFWGLRGLKVNCPVIVGKPRVEIECSGSVLNSATIPRFNRFPNFPSLSKHIELHLPLEETYQPPLVIKAVDCRSFGRSVFIALHDVRSVQKYHYNPPLKKKKSLLAKEKLPPMLPKMEESKTVTINMPLGPSEVESVESRDSSPARNVSIPEDTTKDWWTKYYRSLDALLATKAPHTPHAGSEETSPAAKIKFKHERDKLYRFLNLTRKSAHEFDRAPSYGSSRRSMSTLSGKSGQTNGQGLELKLYTSELEAQPEFSGFNDVLSTFDLRRGKVTAEEGDHERVVGVFKGAFRLTKLPLPDEVLEPDPLRGFFRDIPMNVSVDVLVRLYVVRGRNLVPKDNSGKSDPYIVIRLGNTRFSDREHYIPNQLNPIFGKCYELKATFPQDAILTVQLFDMDLITADDFIGETKIDLENRYYSKHRGTCGLPTIYEESGYNHWRDSFKPTEILTQLCDREHLRLLLLEDGIDIEGTVIKTPPIDKGKKSKSGTVRDDLRIEEMALTALHHWDKLPRIGCHLVPEHVETRSLYNPDLPGIEQGKLELWVDMFPMDMALPGPAIDISPRKPKEYELRVIIWNTEDVVLQDDAFFTGEKMSDIYVKGWLRGPHFAQSTDIHYRSLTGEGNFNWRFIFPILYCPAEHKMIVTEKSLFKWDETIEQIPALLTVQVWDADSVSADDFLGSIDLDMSQFPRAAKTSRKCTLKMLEVDDSVPLVNIFRAHHIRGWYPVFNIDDRGKKSLTGKVELEIELVSKEEAERSPAGFGRHPPNPLENPKRPDSSFRWFFHPLKSFRYIIWKNYKWKILKILIIIALVLIIVIFSYALPGYVAKKVVGV